MGLGNSFKKLYKWSSHWGAIGSAVSWEQDAASTPCPAQWVKDPMLPNPQLFRDPRTPSATPVKKGEKKMTCEPRSVWSEGLSPEDIWAGMVQLFAILEPNFQLGY